MIAQQHKDTVAACEAAEAIAIAKDQVWDGEGYTKYTFDDNSVLIQSGTTQYAMDADDADSINGYADWLDAEARTAEDSEIKRLLEAVEDDA
ncbi:TPA: anti-CRISPR protein AcrF2 [Pseudomonas aeruginosa]|uniref:anti-CRISPR protein AcrF2 n=1 Tax=Pseudomonas aeruginosa group TaxID=136841 RepID=UPI00053EECBB|nr:anti-CRISPR protein AcrF2 [Pseudomonas aeruginosa]MBO8291647.1 anti-CRISPR protein AcrF2 [Pseudomonas aeruginosa]MCV0359491.1 anti-CRISPR protein AcrF2 [Pseudomonas aeruginosa]MDG4063129.1 anti-CRISPR protein AcrF2 [Pseudomonas aeruginosa]MDY1100560.1 anti-CRISPR protein AcrF2 [Pseudomonas aeruginosa]MDY1359325.1 anti-CRISPR protein AcrF2 [Pseudomonas aeruginosa]